MINCRTYTFSIGKITIFANETDITQIKFKAAEEKGSETPLIKEAAEQFREYFAGTRKKFELPILLDGTEFQKRVWYNLMKIPYGTVITYKELAQMSGNEKACRAAGMANNKNKLPIIIPCHRVIGSGGRLAGYAGGIEIKQKLLELEGVFL